MISNPPSVCFDETYFGNFTNYYLERQFFFDVHPPTGKIILVLFSLIFGYKGKSTFSPAAIYLDHSYVKIRSANAIFSSFVPCFIYSALRNFQFSMLASLTSALMSTFEALLIVEGRFILTDGILHFFVSFSLFSLSLMLHYSFQSKKWKYSLILTGITIGFSVSTKLTSLSLFPISFFVLFYLSIVNSPNLRFISLHFLWNILLLFIKYILLPSFFIYFMAFYLNSKILINPGPDSRLVCPEMTKYSINSPESFEIWRKKYVKTSSFFKIKKYIKYILETNKIFDDTDEKDMSSRWWKWPLLSGGVITYYYHQKSRVLCFIQPFNGFFGFFVLLFHGFYFYFCILLEKANEESKKIWWRGSVFVLGYLLSLLPFSLVPRALYIYHYSIPLLFMLCSVATFIDLVACFVNRHYFVRYMTPYACIIFSFLFFFKYHALIYGKPADFQHDLFGIL